MEGEVTIKLPLNEHLLLNLTSSGLAGPGNHFQCVLCDQKAFEASDFIHLRCIPARIITIGVREA